MFKIYRTKRLKKIVDRKFDKLWIGKKPLINKVFDRFVCVYNGEMYYSITGHKNTSYILQHLLTGEQVKLSNRNELLNVSAHTKTLGYIGMKLKKPIYEMDFNSMNLGELREVNEILTIILNNYE